MTEDAPIGSVRRSIAILEALRERGPIGVSALAAAVDLPTSTAYDHLRTLEGSGFVVRTDEGYRIGARFLEIGGAARKRDPLFQVAEPEIQTVAKRTGEHANLVVEECGDAIFYAIAEGAEAFRLDTHVGKRVHLATTAAGKAIMATFDDERVEALVDERGLPAVTDRTITDRERLFEELEACRERGFAIDDEERVPGVRCVGAAITDERGDALGAISVSGPKRAMRGERFREEVPELVLRTANVVEVNFQHR